MSKVYAVALLGLGVLGWLAWGALNTPPVMPKPVFDRNGQARMAAADYVRARHPEYTETTSEYAVLFGEGSWHGRSGDQLSFVDPEWLENGQGIQYVVGYIDRSSNRGGFWGKDPKISQAFWWKCSLTDDGASVHVSACQLDQPPGRKANGYSKR